MAVPMGRHKIGNFMFEKIGGKLPFRVREDYQHTWKETPILGPSAAGPPPLVITKRLGDVVVTFNDATDVILHEDYRWDGNSGPAPNQLECLRASALHDAWSQAIEHRIFARSYRNWRRGAKEYRKVVRDDGLNFFRAWWRYTGLMVYGAWKKFVKRELTEP